MTKSCVRATLVITLVLITTGCRRGGERVLEVRQPGTYHRCGPLSPWPAPDTMEIDRQGGTLRSGNSVLTVPGGAVPGNSVRRFVLATVQTPEVGVDVTVDPPGRLRRTATLVIDTRCSLPSGRFDVWRVRADSGRSERLQTDIRQGRATVGIDTTSKFMIAN